MLEAVRARLPAGALVLAVLSLVNLAIAFAREATIAYFFGTSPQLDSFLVALALPSLLAVNFAAISVAVILPVYVGYRSSGRTADATTLVQRWFLFAGAVTVGVCAILFLTSDIIMYAIAPGFDAAQRAEAATWLRLLLPYMGLVGMAGVFTAVLNSHGRFAVPAVAPPLLSLCVLAACIAGASRYGVAVLPFGFVVGGVLVFAWQCANSRRLEPRLPTLAVSSGSVRLPVAAAAAMALHSIARQVDVAVDRAFASALPDGSVAAYNYAQRLNAIPSAIVTSALATALFPVLARMAAGEDWEGALRTVRRWSLVLIAFGIGPVLFLVFYRTRVVSLVFERGAFGASGVQMTADVLQILPLLLLVTGVSTLFTHLLLVQKRTQAVAAIALAAIAIKIGLNFVLVHRFGLVGLAAATVIAATVATTLRVSIASIRPDRQPQKGRS